MGHKKFSNPQRREVGFVKGIKPKGFVVRRGFGDIGQKTSVADAPNATIIHGSARSEFQVFGLGSTKRGGLSMKAALDGVKPVFGSDNSVSWKQLSGREPGLTTHRVFDISEGGSKFKRVTQRRMRSGSIIESHSHRDSSDSTVNEDGALLHMDRNKRVQLVTKQNRKHIQQDYPNKYT